jgi:hypothetical protein
MRVAPGQADRRVFRVRWRLLGRHYHARIFSAENTRGTYANLGTLTMDTDDWLTFLEHVGTRWEFVQDNSLAQMTADELHPIDARD